MERLENNNGIELAKLKRFEEAIYAYNKAIIFDP